MRILRTIWAELLKDSGGPCVEPDFIHKFQCSQCGGLLGLNPDYGHVVCPCGARYSDGEAILLSAAFVLDEACWPQAEANRALEIIGRLINNSGDGIAFNSVQGGSWCPTVDVCPWQAPVPGESAPVNPPALPHGLCLECGTAMKPFECAAGHTIYCPACHLEIERHVRKDAVQAIASVRERHVTQRVGNFAPLTNIFVFSCKAVVGVCILSYRFLNDLLASDSGKKKEAPPSVQVVDDVRRQFSGCSPYQKPESAVAVEGETDHSPCPPFYSGWRRPEHDDQNEYWVGVSIGRQKHLAEQQLADGAAECKTPANFIDGYRRGNRERIAGELIPTYDKCPKCGRRMFCHMIRGAGDNVGDINAGDHCQTCEPDYFSASGAMAASARINSARAVELAAAMAERDSGTTRN